MNADILCVANIRTLGKSIVRTSRISFEYVPDMHGLYEYRMDFDNYLSTINHQLLNKAQSRLRRLGWWLDGRLDEGVHEATVFLSTASRRRLAVGRLKVTCCTHHGIRFGEPNEPRI